MYSRGELVILGRALIGATGWTVSRLSREVAGDANTKLFTRLFAGRGCSAASLEAASDYFNDAAPWPEGSWPDEVDRRCR